MLYAKNAKGTESKETIGFFVTFLSLVAFQSGGGAFGPARATSMLLKAIQTKKFVA